MKKNYCFLLFLVVVYYNVCSEASRTISCHSLNVSSEDALNVNVAHIVSEGDEDVVHFIWSTYKLPSVIVARTTKNTSLTIDPEKLISFKKGAISFSDGKPLESLGVTFSKLWELHYQNDSSPIETPKFARNLNMESLNWTNLADTLECSDSFASVNLKAQNDGMPFSKAGMFGIQFSVSGNQGLSNEFPHLVFTGNSTLLKFVMDNLYSNESFTRYGFGISLFSTLSKPCKSDEWNSIVTDSINDEVSPGVFSDVELLAPCSDKMEKESVFLSWRPVAYTGIKPIVANTSDVTMSEIVRTKKFEISSIAELYFQDKSPMSFFNVTFGTVGDGCYVSTKYTAWSLMAGTGSMVEVSLSKIVIILASVGVGLLLIFLLYGSVFVLYQKCRRRDDDLLLN